MATAMARVGRDWTVGDVLGRSFATLGAAPALFLGTSFALAALPYALLAGAFRTAFTVPQPGTPPAYPFHFDAVGGLPVFGGAVALYVLLYFLAHAMLVGAAMVTLDGGRPRLGPVAGRAAAALLPLIGMTLLLWLAVWLASILLVVPGVMLAVAWVAAVPALVGERRGVIGSLRRSAALTRGSRWRVFGLILLVFAVYLAAAGVVGASAGAGAVAAAGRVGAAPIWINTVLSAVLQTGFTAIWSIIQAALFAELRDRRDGPAAATLADIFA